MNLPQPHSPFLRRPAPRSSRLKPWSILIAGVTLSTLSASAATYNYTGGNDQYTTASNWSGGVVPNTANGDTAIISNGAAVTYTPGGDLTLANGGMLQVTNGSFTQAGGNNYIQLNGNGSILVSGGTFNQGTASSTPFNLNNTTGNAFTVTSGAANFNTSFEINVGLTFTQSGGLLTVGGNEADFSGGNATLSGGIFNTKLITGVNGPGGNHIFNISGGTLNLTGTAFNGIYGGGTTQYINFTPGSAGRITFSGGSTTVADVQGFVNNGVIEYNSGGTGTLSNFDITSSNGIVTLQLMGNAVPEPSTFAVAALGVAALASWTLRRRARQTV